MGARHTGAKLAFATNIAKSGCPEIRTILSFPRIVKSTSLYEVAPMTLEPSAQTSTSTRIRVTLSLLRITIDPPPNYPDGDLSPLRSTSELSTQRSISTLPRRIELSPFPQSTAHLTRPRSNARVTLPQTPTTCTISERVVGSQNLPRPSASLANLASLAASRV